MNYRQVIARAIGDEMAADDRVILLGEDVAAAGGAFKTTVGLLERFGPQRVRDTPISEQAIVGAALGAALMGLRPVAEIMFADFAGVCFDQLANQLAKYRYMSGGQFRVPVTIRMANGAGAGFAAQHSQPAENWLLNVPGLKIAVPATVADLYGLLRTAIRDDNPVVVFEHKNLFAVKGEVGPDAALVPLGVADVVRRGGDLTVVATQQMRHRAVEAAGRLAADGVEATVIDPRTLVPFDDETVVASLTETSRLLVVQEGPAGGSWGASLVARIAQDHFDLLDAPPVLVASDDTPVPYAGPLEDAWLPTVDRIVDQAHRQLAY
ncbi:alpha-ketoacid dehydrogenase subunit beta [Actinophytocola xinjiangensis]|uniref:Alpha-ketoacid dehydrogenase subunit beta n=1 Tax=Actinophytocola xinjiangensis TaxID=485602 RepID=A0A7Z0WE09_9PSEU|nr:alpha-ketoacid dehydrogenase subunit beta [Actinophytocola xinjiangensis]OLF05171.1 alpha-ketoacid dehydrogenase subunit beta [Actinophytocola xinjiangensis]